MSRLVLQSHLPTCHILTLLIRSTVPIKRNPERILVSHLFPPIQSPFFSPLTKVMSLVPKDKSTGESIHAVFLFNNSTGDVRVFFFAEQIRRTLPSLTLFARFPKIVHTHLLSDNSCLVGIHITVQGVSSRPLLYWSFRSPEKKITTNERKKTEITARFFSKKFRCCCCSSSPFSFSFFLRSVRSKSFSRKGGGGGCEII